jgi:hypothetical protein
MAIDLLGACEHVEIPFPCSYVWRFSWLTLAFLLWGVANFLLLAGGF